jgi:hypothetical protein
VKEGRRVRKEGGEEGGRDERREETRGYNGWNISGEGGKRERERSRGRRGPERSGKKGYKTKRKKVYRVWALHSVLPPSPSF